MPTFKLMRKRSVSEPSPSPVPVPVHTEAMPHRFFIAPGDDAPTEIFRVRGTVSNDSSVPWAGAYAVGIRNFKDGEGRLIPGFEYRCDIGSAPVLPGSEIPFTFSIKRALLPPTAVTCEFDVVKEGEFWLSDRGATPVVVDVLGENVGAARNEWLIALYRLSSQADTVERQKIEIIGEVLERFNFDRYDAVHLLRRLLAQQAKARPYLLLAPTSAAVATAAGRDRRSDALFTRFAFECGVLQSDTQIAEDQVDVFRRFILEGRSFFRGGCAPLPEPLNAWLNRRALPNVLARSPVTRGMLAAMKAGQSLIIGPEDEGVDLIWWYATTVLIDGGLSEGAIPDAVAEMLSKPASRGHFDAAFPRPSMFMARLHDDLNYRERYNMKLAADRCAYAFDLILLALENESRRVLIGREVLAWMLTPIESVAGLCPFEILLLANVGACPGDGGTTLSPQAKMVRTVLSWLPQSPLEAAPATIRVVGEYASSHGLGVNMHMSIAALERIGAPIEVIDVETELLHPPKAPAAKSPLRLSRPVDLFHLNMDAVPGLVCRYSSHVRKDVVRIGFALWETSAMPEIHRPGADLVHEIWAPTQFVADVYRNQGYENVSVVGKGITLGRVDRFDLRSIGVEDGQFTLLVALDVNSWVERKNPMAAVRAFTRAFAGDRDVRLIIKTTGLFMHPGDRKRQVERLLAAADADDRIILLSEHLPFASYLGLIAACDATVSPHRSEGFGYFPAYSSLLGVPTIVTDYSGTRDFCTEETAFPVQAELVPVGRDFVYEAPGAVWADIDVDALAAAMAEVRSDPRAARARAEAGRRFVEREYSLAALATRYAELLKKYGEGSVRDWAS